MSEKANVDLMKGSSGSKACSLCMISLSLIFCALSGVASVWLPKYINDAIVDSGTICDANDENFEDYTTPENSITENWFFYSWDEAEALAFTRGQGTAKVTEMGPYTWDKKTYTYDVTFANGEMTYTDYTVYVYNVAESSTDVSLDDEIIVESLGYQSILSVAMSEGTLHLNAKGCGVANIAAIGTDLAAHLTDVATRAQGGTAADPKPNSFCKFEGATPGVVTNPYGTFTDVKIDPTVDGEATFGSACICCVPPGLGETTWGSLGTSGALAAIFGGEEAKVQICNDLVQDPVINGLFDVFMDNDRALRDASNTFYDGTLTTLGLLSQSYHKNRVTDPDATGINDGKFPITATFHKITVKELAFGYASAFVGKLKLTGDIAAAKAGVIAGLAQAGLTNPTDDDVYGQLNAIAPLMALGNYNNAIYSACLLSQRCSTDASRDAIFAASGNALDTDLFIEAANFDSVVANGFSGVYLLGSKCVGEIDLAVADALSPGITATFQASGLDIDGMSCRPASVGYAVANHFCGMREDFVAGDGVKGVLGTQFVDIGTPLPITDPASRRGAADCKCFGDTNIVGERLKYQVTPTIYPDVAGCCLAFGNNVALGGNLAGFGCMVPIPGRVPGQRDSLVLAKAANNNDKKFSTRNTGCEAGEEENAWNQVNYQGKTEYSAYVTGLTVGADITLTEVNASPLVPDVVTTLEVSQALADDLKYLPSPYMMSTLIKQVPVANLVTSAVYGGNGAQIPPQGLDTRSFGGAHLNDNVAVKDTFILYETNSKIGLSVSNTGASVVKEIPTQRYELKADALHGSGNSGVRTGTNADIGVGFPFDGIVPFAWERAAPVAISQPNFFNGKNGGTYLTTANAPDGVAIDAVQILDYTSGTVLTQSDVDLDAENYQTYFDVEISTGKTFQVHQRLQLNTFFGACHESQTDCTLIELKNPLLNPDSKLTSIYNVRTPDMLGDNIVPIYRLDRNAVIKDDSADAFKGLEKMMQLADIGSIICLLFGVVLGLFGIVKCMQN